jgi:murein DD-endopeptidase MepM/ murein hydrolase activator NlpD
LRNRGFTEVILAIFRRGRILRLTSISLLLLVEGAAAFDPARYQPADLDVISARKPPVGRGVDVFPARAYRFDVTLASRAAPCKTDFLKWAMQTSGIEQSQVQSIPISRCIKVRSAKGKVLSVFIQDVLTESLEKEVPQDGKLTLYATLIYFGQEGPGMIVNEFTRPQTKQQARQDCGCGKDSHSGGDYSAPAGTPISVMEDGIVVKVEENEQAMVNIPTAGQCGRYVVVKHTFPNGRAAFTRYTHLGRLKDKTGKAISVGLQVRKGDNIGEVGSKGIFHFEVRPLETATMDKTAAWTQLYGAEPSMDWSRFGTVDPQTFEADVFGSKNVTPASKK